MLILYIGQVSDFTPLTENLDQEKYTIYLWDPPGYGSSRPPNRDFSPGFLNRDADYAIALMEVKLLLNIVRVSR